MVTENLLPVEPVRQKLRSNIHQLVVGLLKMIADKLMKCWSEIDALGKEIKRLRSSSKAVLDACEFHMNEVLDVKTRQVLPYNVGNALMRLRRRHFDTVGDEEGK